MGGISNAQVEWALINRLKAMLDDPPKTKFNITQTFSLFSTILLWSKNRAWVGGYNPPPAWPDPIDARAHAVRQQLQNERIVDPPWLLSLHEPALVSVKKDQGAALAAAEVNADFQNMSADQFVKWLRDAFGHGDGRTIRPLHRHKGDAEKTWLIGFEIRFQASINSPNILHLHLYEADMRRIGSRLADLFCTSLSGGNKYFEEEIGTKERVTEAKTA
ncbi:MULTISPECIES: hypothetical protein [unclassified Mesorhizobium]|uniref:hypothetical protein n=1 Tax=unclassified Mesorhizobium TaxID=325217 RepID=UPI001126A852|nr:MULTISPECIES: hypothetical protein [unclassified Mesorhizobium]MBZ9696470.1 hypothetical protein [Mesorhizobium sp. CO1-1-9]TPK11630.1 hypothetical protein FJ543_19780 [Mesorhizobium sp. B2-5-7]